jgi:acetolactate synthase-1/2/3 large subunit
MNANELIIAKKYDLPLLMILFNNNTLGMVRQWQKMFSHQRYSETDVNDALDYVLLAKAHGIEGRKVSSMEELKETLSQYDTNESLLIECMIDVDENVLPIVPPGEEIDKFIL